MGGVLWAGTSFAAAQAHIEFERSRLDLETLRRQIARHGVHPRLTNASGVPPQALSADTPSPADLPDFLRQRYRPLLIGVLLGLCGLVTGLVATTPALVWTSRLLYAASILCAGFSIFRAAFFALRARTMDMN